MDPDRPSEPGEEPVAESAAALPAELAHARAVLERLTDEYEVLLADPDAIQEDRDSTRQLVEDARRHVRELEQAEQRVHAGTYGTCAACGRPIAPERLEALPDAATCVSCG
jgi:DnaK suppressor protein